MNRDDYLSASGADYIRAMFENTGSDGTLTLESEEAFTYRLNWKAADLEKTLMDFEQLRRELIRLGKSSVWEPAEAFGESWNEELLPPMAEGEPAWPLRQRASRYAKLISLQASGLLLENEERCLAEELVLYYHRLL